MTRFHPKDLKEGMVLARSIVGEDGRILLKGGIRLRCSYIERLRRLDIPAVYILDPGEKYVPSEIVPERVRAHAVQQVKEAFEAVAIGRPFCVHAIEETVDRLLDEILATRSPILGLEEIRAQDAYTYRHSVNVCVISLLLGITLGLSMGQLRELGVGALLHDIGKVHVPPEILRKTGPLSQEETDLMRRHTKWGYDHLRAYPDLSILSARVAWQHHERLDGSGYPLGVRADRIHLYSRLVMVADVYDAMTSERPYRAGLDPLDVLRHLQRLSGQLFASDVVDALAQVVSPYPRGARVLLNTGEVAKVIEVNPALLERPRVRILETSRPDRLSVPFEIDLQRDLSRSICKVIHE